MRTRKALRWRHDVREMKRMAVLRMLCMQWIGDAAVESERHARYA